MPEFFTSVHHELSNEKFRNAWEQKTTELLLPYSTQVPSADALWFRFPWIEGSTKHISMFWLAHDIKGRARTQDWINQVSKDVLAPGLLEVVREFNFPNGTQLSVDGLLVPEDGMGFAELKRLE